MRCISVLLLLTAMTGCGGASQQSMTGPGSSLRVADAALASDTPTVALQVLDNILKTEPRNTEALLRQGRAHLMLGNNAAAEVSYRKALAIDEGLTDARLGLAKLIMTEQPAEAERMFAAVIKADPKNTAALNNLGVTRDLQGRHADAQIAYNQALAITPGLASARQNLALSLTVSGRPQEGAAMLNTFAQNGAGGRRARDNLAVALALSGNTTEAGQVLREGMSPTDALKALAGYRGLGSVPAR